MTNVDASINVTWPATHFYWARLDASELRVRGVLGLRRKPSPTQLGYLFENSLPLPVDELQVAYKPIRDEGKPRSDMYLACGIERSRLRAELPPHAVTLTPRNLREIEALQLMSDVDSSAFNLLHGEFQPAIIMRLRRRTGLVVIAATLVLGALVTLGLLRRAASLDLEAQAWHAAQIGMLDRVLGAASHNSSQPQHVQLTIELRRLRLTRHSDPSALPDGSTAAGSQVTAALIELLRHWPETNSLTQSLSFDSRSILIHTSLPDASQVQRLIDGLQPLPGWTLQQPAIRADREGFDLDLRFEPTAANSQSLAGASEARR